MIDRIKGFFNETHPFEHQTPLEVVEASFLAGLGSPNAQALFLEAYVSREGVISDKELYENGDLFWRMYSELPKRDQSRILSRMGHLHRNNTSATGFISKFRREGETLDYLMQENLKLTDSIAQVGSYCFKRGINHDSLRSVLARFWREGNMSEVVLKTRQAAAFLGLFDVCDWWNDLEYQDRELLAATGEWIISDCSL